MNSVAMLPIQVTLDNYEAVKSVGPCMIKFFNREGGLYKISAVARACWCMSDRATSYQRAYIGRVEVFPTETVDQAREHKFADPFVAEPRRERYRRIYRPRKNAYLDQIPHYVYRHISAFGEVLYIGCTFNLRQRHADHRATRRSWLCDIDRIEFARFPNKTQALREEKRLINLYQPPNNWLHTNSWDGISPVCESHPAVIKAKAA